MELRNWFELVRIQLRREEGQTMTEYGVLLALLAVGVIAVLLLLGPKITSAFNAVYLSLSVDTSYGAGSSAEPARTTRTALLSHRRTTAAK